MLSVFNKLTSNFALTGLLLAFLVSPCESAPNQRRSKSIDEASPSEKSEKDLHLSTKRIKKPTPLPKDLRKAIKKVTARGQEPDEILSKSQYTKKETPQPSIKRSQSLSLGTPRPFEVQFVEAFMNGTLAKNEILLERITKRIGIQEKQKVNSGSSKVRYKEIVKFNGEEYFLKIATEAKEILNLNILRGRIKQKALKTTTFSKYHGREITTEICLPVRAETIPFKGDKLHIVLQPIAQGKPVHVVLKEKIQNHPENKNDDLRAIGHAIGFTLGTFHQLSLDQDMKGNFTAVLHGDAHLNNFFILYEENRIVVSLIDLETMIDGEKLARGALEKDVQKMLAFSFAHRFKGETYHIHKLVGLDKDKIKLLTAREWQEHGVGQLLHGYISSFQSTERDAVKSQVLKGVKEISSSIMMPSINGSKFSNVLKKFEKDLSE